MNYKKIYDEMCLDRKAKRGCEKESGFEVHHILPRSMGGTNEDFNLVKLTYKEHFLAHKLLFRITRGTEKVSMAFALMRMSAKNSREYQKINEFLKYSNKIPVRDIQDYVYAKLLKFDNVSRQKIKHKDFNNGPDKYRVRLSTLFFICRSFIEEGIKGFTSVHRSKWKNYILELEVKGYISTFYHKGSKFYKFNIDNFKKVKIMESKLFNLTDLLIKSELSGINGNLRSHNLKDLRKSIYVENSYIKGKYFILPVCTGWVPSNKPLLTKKEILCILKSDESFLNNP